MLILLLDGRNKPDIMMNYKIFTEEKIIRFAKFAIITILIIGIPLSIFVLAKMGNSEKVKLAEAYLENDSIFLSTAGTILDHDFFFSDKPSLNHTTSYMRLGITGSKRHVTVIVFFKKDSRNKWIVERYTFQ